MKLISRTKYLEILGLLILARRAVRQLNEIEAAVADITGDDDLRQSSDAVWGGDEPTGAANRMLTNLGIQVAE